MTDPRRRVFAGLCDRCVHQRVVPTRRSVFSMCEAPGMRQYPVLPVMRCAAFAPRDARSGGDPGAPPPGDAMPGGPPPAVG